MIFHSDASKLERYRQAFNFRQRVVILATKQSGEIVKISMSPHGDLYTVKTDIGVLVSDLHKSDIDDYELWRGNL